MSVFSFIKKWFIKDDEILKVDNVRSYKDIEDRIVRNFIDYADFNGVEWDELHITVKQELFFYFCEFAYSIDGQFFYLHRKDLNSIDFLERDNYFKMARGKKGCIAFFAVDYINRILDVPDDGFNTITIDKKRNLILNDDKSHYKRFEDQDFLDIFTDKEGVIGSPFLNDELEDISHVALSYTFEQLDVEDSLSEMFSELEVDFSLNLKEIEDLERRFNVKITLDVTGECIFDDEAKALALEDSRFSIE
jgi:hypothetical protein